MFTPRDVIQQARYLTNDTESEAAMQRQTDDELLSYLNEGVREMANFMPMMFSTIGDMTCQAGKVEQSVTFADAQRLLDVICIHDGPSLTPFDRMTLDLFSPEWRTGAPGQARQWSPLESDPLIFYLDRPAPVGQVLDVRYVRIPTVYAIDDPIGDVPETMAPALADYVVYRAEMKDDENVLSQRAMAHYAAFKQKIGVVENAAAN